MNEAPSIREIYRQACHGAGAEPRMAARLQLLKLVDESGQRLGEFFDRHGLDLSAYFASRPIS